MGYRREPRCGNCWKTGHIKTSCPTLSDYMKSQYKKIAKERACRHCNRNGYPNAVGHNKRGCKLYREDREAYKIDVINFRKLCVQYYDKHNIGIGSVVSIPISQWRRYGLLADVENDILFVKEYHSPNKLYRPTFKLYSTITNTDSYSPLHHAGDNNIIFDSVNKRLGQREINLGSDRSLSSLVLTPRVEGTILVEDLTTLDREDDIEYPDNME